ncbi:hypothetical protein IFM89_004227 [Coptis chinensis]|uniref:SHSP domain-containing protein n=1 Tax=Coptis chinensis TaxID=261450 RepID=A0A835M1E3_9MAGN|nr:hypothetical protein IFM89_004227 [Coptis chinensis]
MILQYFSLLHMLLTTSYTGIHDLVLESTISQSRSELYKSPSLLYADVIEPVSTPRSIDRFKVDKIQAEMKNGVLKVTVPKLKYEERKNSDSLYLFSDSL